MRKLVYVGKDNVGNVVKTESYTEKQFWATKGFEFTDTFEETEKKTPDLEKIRKIREALAKKRG